MQYVRELIGLPVLAPVSTVMASERTPGSVLGYVRDLILDIEEKRLLALVLTEEDSFWLVDAEIVIWTEVQGISENGIYVQSIRSKLPMHMCHHVQKAAETQKAILFTNCEAQFAYTMPICISDAVLWREGGGADMTSNILESKLGIA